jgi:hypothetical protein
VAFQNALSCFYHFSAEKEKKSREKEPKLDGKDAENVITGLEDPDTTKGRGGSDCVTSHYRVTT